MAWIGYYEYDGTEIINVSRTEAYAAAFGIGWFKPLFNNHALGPMLGETYFSPIADDADWVDPDNADSFGFMGVYPLSVSGIEDSTINATITESVLDGGVVNRPRRNTRAVVFSAALVGVNEASVEYGLRWLRSALSGAPCQDSVDCAGSNLCYLSSVPLLPEALPSDVMVCLDPLLRSLHKVNATTGPSVTAKFDMPTGGCAWTVTWTLVAGTPYEFMVETPLVEDFPAPGFYINPAYPPVSPPHPWSNTAGDSFTDTPCPAPVYQPVYDPACPFVISPPSVPSVPVSCFSFPTVFNRWWFKIPADLIPLYGASVPIVTIRTDLVEVRNLRMRFYADVLDLGDPELDPCAWCGDIVFSYIPAGSNLIFDAADKLLTIQTPGKPPRRADAVVYKSDGTPFEWPELSCGFSYMAVFDLPGDESFPVIDVSIMGKVA